MRLDDTIAAADLVVTGEGSLDSQTLDGKGPHGVAVLARAHAVPVVGIGGRTEPAADSAFDLTLAATPPGLALEEAMRRAPALIESAICQAAPRLLTLAG
jgi:glycerate kinase